MSSHIEAQPRDTGHLPGEPGVWMFILGDMLMFALFFAVFLWYRGNDLELFSASQRLLSQGYGMLNTLIMLTSSWFVVTAVDAARARRQTLCRGLLALAMTCGVAFVTVKYFEWSEKIAAGYGLTSNDFFMYYYMLTGIHMLHVVIGTGVLLFLWRVTAARPPDPATVNTLASGASFWHMVDILWIVLFALLYLVR